MPEMRLLIKADIDRAIKRRAAGFAAIGPGVAMAA
jgi:hypothetical protein